MRLSIRVNRYQIGAIAALFVAVFFMSYQKFDIASWVPFAPQIDRLSANKLFIAFMMISFCFSFRNSLDVEATGPKTVLKSIAITLAAVLFGISIFSI